MQNVFALDQQTADGAMRAWILGNIARGKSGDFQVRVEMTPALAKLLLDEFNSRNRRYRPWGGEDWAARLKRGQWLVTSQGISIAVDGNMNNGQHRLHGIVLSGMTVPIWVMFGEPVEAFYVLDTQRIRTSGDALHVLGEKNSVSLAAAARLLMVVTSSQPRSMSARDFRNVAHTGIAEIVMGNPGLRDAIAPGSRFRSALPKTSGAGASVAYYLISQQSVRAARLDEFWEIVVTGIGVAGVRDPINMLRRGIQSGRLIRTKSASGPHTAACIIIAWNAWTDGRSPNGVAWPDGSPFPVPR